MEDGFSVCFNLCPIVAIEPKIKKTANNFAVFL